MSVCVVYFQTYVLDNDLYFQETPFHSPSRLTTTKLEDHVFNGIPDWVYEGEYKTFMKQC